MKRNVSKLLAVTLFTPNKIVLSSFPCEKQNSKAKKFALTTFLNVIQIKLTVYTYFNLRKKLCLKNINLSRDEY